MKVLIPFSYYYPETCAGIFVVDDLMHRLAADGHECVLYVPTPTRAVKADVPWSRDEYLCEGRIHIHRFRMYGEGKNPVLRALRYVFCECYYLHRMLWDRYDVAFIDSTPPIQGLKLPIVRLLRRKPVVYNAQDLFPETLSGTGLANQGGLLWKIGSLVARITFRSADKIIAISNDIKRNIMAKDVPEEKIEVIYNWVDENAVVPVAKGENPLFEEFGISRERFTVVYAGNLGNAQNIGIIMDAARALKGNEGIQFVIFGKGGLEDEIKLAREREHLENLMILPLQPFERVSQVYGLGDVCIVACKPGLGGAAMPSKTWSIMSSGRAVLANFDEGELKNILEGCYDNPSTCSGRADDDDKVGACGVFTKAGDLEGFVSAIERLSQNPALCAQMGRNGREFILRNLTKEVGTGKYVEVIKSVAL